MVSFSENFPCWYDFPEGLHVLVVDNDTESLRELKTKLESFSYAVTTFTSGEGALVALNYGHNGFHVVLVEATLGNGVDSLKILEAARHLPTIMMSHKENMAIMMSGFASGASEVLQKPLSDESLKNIWQHVILKANGDAMHPATLRQGNVSLPSLTESPSQSEPVEAETFESGMTELGSAELRPADLWTFEANDCSLSSSNHDVLSELLPYLDRLATPATPQSEPTGRMNLADYALDEYPISGCLSGVELEYLDDLRMCEGSFQAQTGMHDVFDASSYYCGFFDLRTKDTIWNADDIESLQSEISTELQFDDRLEHEDSSEDISLGHDLGVDGDVFAGLDLDTSILDGSKFSACLDTSFDFLDDGVIQGTESVEIEALLEDEVPTAEKAGPVVKDNPQEAQQLPSVVRKEGSETIKKANRSYSEMGGKGSKRMQTRRRTKVDWTPELHRLFVQAVEYLGVDKAFPSKILDLMGGQYLTRHNVSSHLQKYRWHKKHLLEREAETARHLDAASRAAREKDGGTPLPIQPRPKPIVIAPHPTTPPFLRLRPSQPLRPWVLPPPPPPPAAAPPPPPPPSSSPWQQMPDCTAFWQQPPACLDAWGRRAPAPGAHRCPCHAAMLGLHLAPMPGVANMPASIVAGGPLSENGDGLGSGNSASLDWQPSEPVDAGLHQALNNSWTSHHFGLNSPPFNSSIPEIHCQDTTSVQAPTSIFLAAEHIL